MKERYSQTASYLGAQNNLCDRVRIINLNCDREREQKKKAVM